MYVRWQRGTARCRTPLLQQSVDMSYTPGPQQQTRRTLLQRANGTDSRAYGPADVTHSLSLASVKSRLVLPFWYRLTRVVPEKGPLNGCVCVCGWLADWVIGQCERARTVLACGSVEAGPTAAAAGSRMTRRRVVATLARHRAVVAVVARVTRPVAQRTCPAETTPASAASAASTCTYDVQTCLLRFLFFSRFVCFIRCLCSMR